MSSESYDSTLHNILCGFCLSPVKPRVKSEPDGEIGCVFCGNWAPKDEVIESAEKYVVDQARQSRNTARDRQSKTFTGNTDSYRRYFFITDSDI
jgi:hypothetical protein